jgi:hypothetical protein
MAASFDYRARRESRDTSAMDETKIIAAILWAQTTALTEDGKVVKSRIANSACKARF